MYCLFTIVVIVKSINLDNPTLQTLFQEQMEMLSCYHSVYSLDTDILTIHVCR